MAQELFGGLDSLIFDQPESIDTSSFNKPIETPAVDVINDTKVDTKVDTKKVDPKATEGTFIDPNDFFNKVKEDADSKKDDVITDEVKDDVIDVDKTETKPEEVLKTWANYFKENNLLLEDDLKEFDGSMETLVTAFQARENRVGLEMVNDYKSQLPAELKFLADNWEEGVPLNKLIDIRSNKLRYSLITEDKLEESVDTQKAVKTEYLKRTTKYSDTKIEKEVARLIDLDELKDEVKEDLGELKKLEAEAEDTLRRETKKEQETRREENAQTIKKYEKFVSSTKEVIPGLKLVEKDQADILNKIINPIGIDGNGNQVSYIASVRNEDPYLFDTVVTYLAKITTDKEGKVFSDWSKILKAGENKAVKSLEGAITTPAPRSVKDGIKTTGKQSLMELLEKNKGIFGK